MAKTPYIPSAQGAVPSQHETDPDHRDVRDADVLIVSACVANQGKYHRRFDHVILLSAPIPVTVERLATRTNNHYGKRPEEIAEVLEFKRDIEPKLRHSASVEIDTSRPLDQVLQEIIALVSEGTQDLP